MTDKRMYFGTIERMTWITMPAINADLSKARWSSEGVFLNGGAFVQRSSAAHMKYVFSWNLAPHEEIYAIADYDDGVYGDDLIYFLDPFARGVNVLPQFWASPRLQSNDAPTLVKNVDPTLVDTASNSYSYPTKSAVYDIPSGAEFRSLWIPIPDGYTFHFGAHGSATGTAAITVEPDGGTATDVSLLAVTTPTLTNTTITGVTGVTISATGIGFLTLAGLVGQVLPSSYPAPSGRFFGGRGHSGCRFSGNGLSINGYSAPEGIDKIGASGTLVETGAWEQ
jgi:hypothetical protein